MQNSDRGIIFTNKRMHTQRSPPPSTGKLKPRNLNQMTSPSKDVISTPLKSETSASKRSNASTGGHRFRAIFSPHVKEDYDDGTEKNAPRVLFH